MSNTLLVHRAQNGNPLLKYISNVKFEYSSDIVPDYVIHYTCFLFVSVRFHFRQPKYISRRIDEVGNNFRLRVLLVLVDDENNLSMLQELNKIAFVNDYVLLLSWSNVEAARYLETAVLYQNKPSTSIQQKEETEYLPKVTSLLTMIRSVNKTDVVTLLDSFNTVGNIFQSNEKQLILLPGIGEKKAKRLHKIMNISFMKDNKSNSSKTNSVNNNGDSNNSNSNISNCEQNTIDITDNNNNEA